MKKLLANILKVSMSNIISLLSGVLMGFIVPKMLGLEGYANYKIYTLYLTYIALLSLGFGDGLYLKFSGLDRDDIDDQQMRYYIQKYNKQLGVLFLIVIVLTITICPNKYRFICLALAVTILTSQTVAVYQNISLLTSRFNEYSSRVILKSFMTSALVVICYVFYKLYKIEISYQLFIIGIIFIDIVLALWYMKVYKSFCFGKVIYKDYDPEYYKLLLLGFPLLLSNMAGTIFLNLDRQFVSILFSKSDYAVYAFAYNMMTLITIMTSAVSLVLFPSLKKVENLEVKKYLEKYMMPFNTVVGVGLCVYFPLCVFIPYFLPKYIAAIEIFRIVLPGLILSTTVSVILINFYKLENKIKIYFSMTIISMVISVISNYLAYKIFKSYQAISWASIFSIFVWYTLCVIYFIKKYKVSYIKNTLYIFIVGLGFYVVTGYIQNPFMGLGIYLIYIIFISSFFYISYIKSLTKKMFYR